MTEDVCTSARYSIITLPVSGRILAERGLAKWTAAQVMA